MDVAAFSGDVFDPKDWINKALRNADPAQTKVVYVSCFSLRAFNQGYQLSQGPRNRLDSHNF